MSDIRVSKVGYVAVAEICRPPHNYFDEALIRDLGDEFERLDADTSCRSIVLAAQGKNFCAGADHNAGALDGSILYPLAVRLFRCRKPIVAAVQGAAVGGGLGLSLVADFRVASPETRFTANFNRLAFHPGFGVSVTLPRVVGNQKAAQLLYTGRRIDGVEALSIGLVDLLVAQEELRTAAIALAAEIAGSAPLAVMSTRETLRGGLADAVAAITVREWSEQKKHFATNDFKEGVVAMTERRAPDFGGT